MADDTADYMKKIDISLKKERYRMNKLRDSGKAYMTSNGTLVPAKVQPKSFCHCPKRCKQMLISEQWEELFNQFYGLGDQNLQNMFLQRHIVIKTVHKQNWEPDKLVPNKRRVTCKYHIPNMEPDEHIRDYLNEEAPITVEVCQKAFMNLFGITEKRVRMQRERCIAQIAPDYYKNHSRKSSEGTKENLPDRLLRERSPQLEISKEAKSDEERSDEPLDLSNHSDRIISSMEIDKSKLYEIAELMGMSRENINKEMEIKYEEMVLKNLKKQQKDVGKNQKFYSERQKCDNLRGISEQVVGLEEDLTILPIQTLNNGDLTITPILGVTQQIFENQDIMLVNNFFQNQLWRPEYIGLTTKQKSMAID